MRYEDLNPTVLLNYHLSDHLGSIILTTDTGGLITELSDYYPYGSIRIDEGSSSKEQRKYIGQEFDASTGLSYLNARYYDGGRGQFLNQDPVFWGNQNLADPQSLNSYSYAGNNPINSSDPSGLLKSDYIDYPKTDAFYDEGAIEGTYYGVPIYSNGVSGNASPNSPYQCPDFVNRFAQEKLGTNLYGLGNGVDYGNQLLYDAKMKNQSGSFKVYNNGGTELPRENDIMVWKSSNDKFGHVGMVVQVDFDTSKGVGIAWTAEQNQSKYSGLFKQVITSSKVNGVTNYTVQKKTAESSLTPSSFVRYQAPGTSPYVSKKSQALNISSFLNNIVSLFRNLNK